MRNHHFIGRFSAVCLALLMLGGCSAATESEDNKTEASTSDSYIYSESAEEESRSETSVNVTDETVTVVEQSETEMTDMTFTEITEMTDLPDLVFDTMQADSTSNVTDFDKDDDAVVTYATEKIITTVSSAVQTSAKTTVETSASATSSVKKITDKASELASSGSSYLTNTYKALNYKEQKGFWISYLEYDNMLKNKTEEQFTDNIGECFDNIKSIGFNTVYVHVRAFGDAYYDSELFPTGDRYNGTIGSDAKFDALQIMIDEAHDRGISIHAWVNPMRLMTTSQIKSLPDTYLVKKWYNSSKYKGTYIVYSGGKWYLNPAYDGVVNYICNGMKEIVSNYDVDGIQIDDYFYPTIEKSFDSTAYKSSGTSLSLSSWRINNVNSMVKKMYKSVHSANNSVIFGISPQGSIENNYNEVYADVKTWCAESGYCDYILPQIYYGFDNPAVPYDDTVSLWSGMVTNTNVKLVIGLAAYKIGAIDNYAGSGKREWLNNSDILLRQITIAKTISNYGGIAIYRYDSLFNPTSEVSAQVSKELKNIKK